MPEILGNEACYPVFSPDWVPGLQLLLRNAGRLAEEVGAEDEDVSRRATTLLLMRKQAKVPQVASLQRLAKAFTTSLPVSLTSEALHHLCGPH